MKIGVNEINKTIEDCKSMGFDLRMADMFYTFALQGFKDKNIVYAVLFGKGATEEEVDEYDTSKKIKFLKKYMRTNFFNDDKKDDVPIKSNKQYEDITFEENKDAMIKMIYETEVAYKDGKIEYKDYSDRITKLRIALNDKFSVSEKQDEQRIIIYPKFNTICERTKTECWLQTKEFAMEHWGLIEDPNKGKKNIKDDDDE